MSINIQSSASFRGVFRQGNLATVILRIIELDGTPRDPEEISYNIVEASTSTVIIPTGVAEKVKTGLYVFDWCIPNDADIGQYIITWNYVLDGDPGTAVQNVVVGSNSPDTSYYSGRLLLFRQSLALMIDAAMTVPVYDQQAKPSRDFQTYYFSKGNWNPTEGTMIYLNGNIQSENFTINYDAGSVTFANPLTDADVVRASYNFQWFTDEQLDRFLANAIHVYNSYAPFTYYNIGTIPDRTIATVLYGAAIDAIRNIMFNISFKEPAKYFGSEERAKEVQSGLNELKKNYEETWKNLLEQKKNFPYRGLHKAIVVPEYTLPGGRSRWFRMLFSGSGDAS